VKRQAKQQQKMSFESFFTINDQFSRVVSFDVTHPEEPIVGGSRRTRAIKHIKRTAKRVHFWTVIVLAALQILLMAIKSLTETDMKQMTETLPFVISMTVDIINAIWFVVHKKQVCDVFAKLMLLHHEVLKKDERKYETTKFFDYCRRFQKAIFYISVVIAVGFIANSIRETISDQKRFVVLIWLPFDGFQSGVYEFISVVLIFVSVSIIALSGGLFLLIFAMISLVAITFECLRKDFDEMKDLPMDNKAELKKLIEKHVEMHSLVKQVENFLAPIFLVKLIQASFVFCLTGFQLSTSKEIPTLVNFGLYFLATMLANFILFYGSQKIIDTSQGIADAVYQIKWYEVKNLKLRKTLVIIMMQAQKGSKLTAGKFSVIGMESFKFMLNSAYSYFALLKTIYSE
jgi:hypothetical protein